VFLVPGEDHFRGRLPWATWALILANLAGFVVQVVGGDRINYGYSLTPVKITSGQDVPSTKLVKTLVPVSHSVGGRTETHYLEEWTTIPWYPGPKPIHLTLLTSMFMHGNLLHLIGNMWFLWIFGTMVEKRLPPGLFLIFYLACGMGAGLAEICANPESVLPCVGASGAISGVMAAYLWLEPLGKLRLWFGVCVIQVPALIGLPIWVLLQYLNGMATITQEEVAGGVAYWAHLGGFATGLVFLLSLLLGLKARAQRRPAAPVPAKQVYTPLATAAYLDRSFHSPSRY
jgi:membrane associated rhomboid family serine protease